MDSACPLDSVRALLPSHDMRDPGIWKMKCIAGLEGSLSDQKVMFHQVCWADLLVAAGHSHEVVGASPQRVNLRREWDAGAAFAHAMHPF